LRLPVHRGSPATRRRSMRPCSLVPPQVATAVPSARWRQGARGRTTGPARLATPSTAPPPHAPTRNAKSLFVFCMALRLPGLTVERGSYLRTCAPQRVKGELPCVIESPLQRGPVRSPASGRLLPFVFVCQIDRRDVCCPMANWPGTPAPGCRGRAVRPGGSRVVGHAQQEVSGGINK